MLNRLILENKDDVLEEMFQSSNISTRKKLIDRVMTVEFVEKAANVIKNDVIKPLINLDHIQLMFIMKYNNIQPPTLSAGSTASKSYRTAKEYARTTADPVRQLNVSKVDKTPEAMDLRTIEYDVFNKYRHGNIGVKFLEEFDVRIEDQITGQDEFLRYMPNTEIIDPAFHGTGSVAASMILRYGFRVITGDSGPITTTGKMLGDGIYFSTVLDKVGQYTSDSGYTRGIGTVGYVFQMKALLGERGVDYKAAGLNPGGRIVSPEWCVFNPNKQLKIYKAFKVEIVEKSYLTDLKKQYKIMDVMEVMEIKTFKEFIKEATGEYENATTYVFMSGSIPVSKDKAVDVSEFDASKFGDHVRVEPGQNGPMVVISHNNEKSDSYCVPATQVFLGNEVELTKFLDLLNHK